MTTTDSRGLLATHDHGSRRIGGKRRTRWHIWPPKTPRKPLLFRRLSGHGGTMPDTALSLPPGYPDGSRDMASKQLTSRKLETIKPDSVRREVPDRLVPALYHIVQPSGARSWCVRFRVNGASRKLTLGPWPALPLAKARELARDAILAVKAGRDPIE